MKIAIYSRKSRFTGRGESIQNQVELCREYAEKNLQVDEVLVYEDEGFSGSSVDRPMFQKMMHDAGCSMFEVLICYRLDRISRSISDFAALIEYLQQQKIAFISIKEQFDTSTPMGRAMMYIASVFAQLERETIAERVRDNMLQLSRSGRWLGGMVPTGYKSQPISYLDKDMRERKVYRLIPVSGELELVKTLFEKYINLGSLTRLESWCLEKGIRTKNDMVFRKSALKLILTNPVYAVADETLYRYFEKNNMDIASPPGEFNGKHSVLVYNKNNERKGSRTEQRPMSEWVVAVGRHSGIVPGKDWVSVQEKLKYNSEKAPRLGTGTIALLTPYLICARCHSRMRVSYKRSGELITQHYYKCILKEKTHSSNCSNKNLNGRESEEAVMNELKRLFANEAEHMGERELAAEIRKKKKNLESSIKAWKRHRAKLEKEYKGYRSSISDLTLQLARNPDSHTSSHIITQLEYLSRMAAQTKEQIEAAEQNWNENACSAEIASFLQSLPDNIPDVLDTLDFHEKRKLLQNIIESMSWDGENLTVNLHGPKESFSDT